MTPLVRVLACGSIDRGDDGAALLAVRLLLPAARRLAQIEEVWQLAADQLLGDAPGTRRVVVDCVAGLPAGTIVELPLAELPALEARVGATSSHALAPGQAVALAAVLDAIGPDDRFIGIGGSAFAMGASLSPSVADAIGELAARVSAYIAKSQPCA
jgi:hydrogenase maturation protease